MVRSVLTKFQPYSASRYLKAIPKLLSQLNCIGKSWALQAINALQRKPPIPPPNLRFLVAGTDDIGWFIRSGQLAARSMQDLLEHHGAKIERLDAILDFGCGADRVIRNFYRMKGPDICGTDYNLTLIEWCKQNLGFAHFQVNEMAAPLAYQDEKFDFIYVLSVFTHLRESQQLFWIRELSRVLKPGGYLLITVHGETYYLPQLLPDDQARFLNGELIVYGADGEGSNICTVFHPKEYVHKKFADGLEIVDHIPEGALGNPRQDIYLFRKAAIA